MVGFIPGNEFNVVTLKNQLLTLGARSERTTLEMRIVVAVFMGKHAAGLVLFLKSELGTVLLQRSWVL